VHAATCVDFVLHSLTFGSLQLKRVEATGFFFFGKKLVLSKICVGMRAYLLLDACSGTDKGKNERGESPKVYVCLK